MAGGGLAISHAQAEADVVAGSQACPSCSLDPAASGLARPDTVARVVLDDSVARSLADDSVARSVIDDSIALAVPANGAISQSQAKTIRPAAGGDDSVAATVTDEAASAANEAAAAADRAAGHLPGTGSAASLNQLLLSLLCITLGLAAFAMRLRLLPATVPSAQRVS